MCTGDHFLNITPVAQTLRAKIKKWDLLILISFCKAKDTDNKKKKVSLMNGKKKFSNSTLDRGLISKIYKELKKLNIKISNNQLKNRVQI